MTSTDLNTYVTFGYLAVGVGFLVVYMLGSFAARMRMVALGLFIFVFALHTASIGLRWIESYQMGVGHAPLSNLYESLIFFAWTIALALIIARLKIQNRRHRAARNTGGLLDHGLHIFPGSQHQAVNSGSSIQLACRSCNHLLSGLCGIYGILCGRAAVTSYQGVNSVRQTSFRNGYSG